MTEIRFDDIEALTAQITDDFGGWSNEILVDQERINAFADVTEDHQWIHLDVERAERELPWKSTIAHGFLTLSLVAGFKIPQPFDLVGFGNILNLGSDRLRFMAPVITGSTLQARSRLRMVKGGRLGTRTATEVHVHIVGQEKPCLAYESLVMFQPKQD